MYVLIRERDHLIIKHNHFKNIHFEEGGNRITDYPPEVNASIFMYDSITCSWQTTLVKSVKKIDENNYEIKTENSNYTLERF